MDAKAKLNLLNEELDEETQKYFQESLEAWKESVTNQILEEAKQAEQAKIEELEAQNEAYRAELREEFTEKMLEGINELKESLRAEAVAEVIKNNPELKIFEQVKEMVAPLVSEDYRENTYKDTIENLSNEVSKLRREKEIVEGAHELSTLLAPFSKNVQDMFLSLIKEGSPEEVQEQFYNIYESLKPYLDEAEDDDDDDEDDDDEEEESSKGSKSDDDDEGDDNDDDDEDETQEESYIEEGYKGTDSKLLKEDNSIGTIAGMLKAYSK